MSDLVDRVNIWEVRSRADGGFGVYDAHGMVAGPYGTREEALDTAMHMTRPLPPASPRQAPATPPAPPAPTDAVTPQL